MSDDLVRRSDAMRVALWFGMSELKYPLQFIKKRVMEIPTAEPKQGEWIEHKERTIVRDNNFIDFFPTEYECSNYGLRQATYFINSTPSNFCPNCGIRMKTAENEIDYERAIEQMQYDMLHEPTYNPEDGSM